jgi:hypothetical protein
MEEFSLVWLLIGALAGLVLGGAGVFAWLRYGGGGAAGSTARRREEAYREEVADHFVKTAELVNQLTDSYKEVFDHLRDGAGSLVDEEILRERLAHRDDDKVTLRRIGYGGGNESGSDSAEASREETGSTEERRQ